MGDDVQNATEAPGSMRAENNAAETPDLITVEEKPDDDNAAASRGAAETTPPVEGSVAGPSQVELVRRSNGGIAAGNEQTEHFAAEPHAVAGDNDSVRSANDLEKTRNSRHGDIDRSRPPLRDGDTRRTLHLSLAQNTGPQSNAAAPAATGSNASERSGMTLAPHQQKGALPQSAVQRPSNYALGNDGGTMRTAPDTDKPRDSGAFIGRVLRERVDEDIAAFLAAFDAALAHDSLESRAGLREATDRLLRAGARTRIELERLEARVPLSVSENRGHPGPNWRAR
ncbi:MAG TPA: hypothetical protein VE687_19655 [Stellaceae bacterium]|nr:hypothetical protein [Stellaceae bacterium]